MNTPCRARAAAASCIALRSNDICGFLFVLVLCSFFFLLSTFYFSRARRTVNCRDIESVSITYLEAIREAQAKALADDPRVFIYGQDVGAFGGAFKATKGLAHEYPGRVIDAP